MAGKITRRDFVKDSIVASAGVAGALGAAGAGAAEKPAGAKPEVTPEDAAKQPMARGKIGDVELSRLMLGGNLISGYSHSRELTYVSALMRHYNTDEKILETLRIAEENGVDSINTAVWDDLSVLQKHLREGSKMKWFIAANPDQKGNMDQVKKAVENGADVIYIQGQAADKLVSEGLLELIGQEVEFIHSYNLPAGVAAHSLNTIIACEKAGFNPDFYQKTLHTHDYFTAPKPPVTEDMGKEDNFWCRDPQAVIDYMAGIKRPWIAFKVMAAGAIPPLKGFQYAVDGGADFVLAGMFDWQIVDDVRYFKTAMAKVQRTRPWFS
ncbi:MAG: twin-arginine translocation signal domain-containing protein [Candidatus Hydrogenedentes bacterium]|nr:twin-arginine translocation signal domain-containing protein [Candidatus Hydrogenedentota bacterium]